MAEKQPAAKEGLGLVPTLDSLPQTASGALSRQ